MNSNIERKSQPLAAAIAVKWSLCKTPEDWRHLQHHLDGIWAAMAAFGALDAVEDVTFLVDLAFEREHMGQ